LVWWPLDLYGLRHEREAFRMRNAVERWFSRLKAKARCFYNNLPFHITLESVARWIYSLTAFEEA